LLRGERVVIIYYVCEFIGGGAAENRVQSSGNITAQNPAVAGGQQTAASLVQQVPTGALQQQGSIPSGQGVAPSQYNGGAQYQNTGGGAGSLNHQSHPGAVGQPGTQNYYPSGAPANANNTHNHQARMAPGMNSAPGGNAMPGGNVAQNANMTPGTIHASAPHNQISGNANTGSTAVVNHATQGGAPQQSGQQQQQQQQQHPRTSWQQNGTDYSGSRTEMATRIINILQLRRPNATQEWQQKLPQMAKRLEDSLFMQATSFDIYMDPNTTKNRLQSLAQSMGGARNNTQAQKAAAQGQQAQSQAGAAHQPQTQVPAVRMHPNAAQQAILPSTLIGASKVPVYNQTGGYPQQGSAPNGGVFSSHGQVGGDQGSHGHQQPQQQTDHPPAPAPVPAPGGGSKMYINMASLNPMLVATNPPPAKPAAQAPAPAQQGQQQAAPAQQGQQQQTEASRHHSAEHRKQVLKQQQQRLLLLRHASKCPHEADTCTVTPHCASMKELWSHIMGCKDQECKVAHCVSSRYVLSHYSKCKDQACPVCGPVREAIRRNYERSSTVINIGKRTLQQAEGHGGGAIQSKTSAFNSNGQPLNKRSRSEGANPAAEKPKLAISMKATNPILDPISCPLYCLSTEEIQAHIKGIHEGVRFTATTIKHMCMPIVEALLNMSHVYGLFSVPVEPDLLGLPDYFEIIKSPMDLGTVKKKLEGGNYRDLDAFARDVRLTFENAMKYNSKASDVHSVAQKALKEFEAKFKQALAKHDAEIEAQRLMENYCMVCAEKVLKFEPPVYYCNGRCGLKIRRGSNFYFSANNAYHWCSQCFNELGDKQTIPLPDCTLMKADLANNKKKHTEESEEPWVACDGCDGWVHQLCALFNGRRNIGEVPFLCPKCVVAKRAKGMDVLKTDKKYRAVDLPHSNLSLFLEKRINQALERSYVEAAKKLDVTVEDVEKVPPLHLRQVLSLDRNQPVREGMVERYKHKNYPTEFPCRTKCLILFQTIDGQDVLLFGMYVYEYGHKCPQPNQRRVYISYLDSVHYFRPRQYRTTVYHEIIVAYLEYVKVRGFHTAHIWACPPLKGDDYILYCHPTDQKNPKDDRLRKWYVDVLEECKRRGIVMEVEDIFATYMSNHANDCTVMPYFEGDYWVNEAEVIIKDLASKKPTAGLAYSLLSDSIENNKSKTKARAKSKSKGRSAPAPPPPPPPVTASAAPAAASATGIERDAIMAKLSSIIEPMKEAFFVVRLRSKEYADAKAKEREDEVAIERGETTEATEEPTEDKEKRLQEEALSETNTSQIADMDMMNKKAKAVQTRYKTRRSSSNPALSSMGESDAASGQSGAEDDDEAKEKALTLAAEESAESETLKEMEMDIQSSAVAASGVAGAQETSAAPDAKPVPAQEAMEVAESKTDEAPVEVKTEDSQENPKPPLHPDTELGPPLNQDKMQVDGPAELKRCSSLNELKDALGKSESSDSLDTQKSEAASAEAGATVKEEIGSASIDQIATMTELLKLKDDTEDVDDVQESDQFDTRQSLLNLCQGNHYQFDQLRRAKHSTMMLLYHLQNPDAPKFVPNCSKCHADILSGNRFHCETCDIDFCQLCISSLGHKTCHHHGLRVIKVGSNTLPQQLTEEEKKERQKHAQLHLQLLLHASGCNSKEECKSRNCVKMKVSL